MVEEKDEGYIAQQGLLFIKKSMRGFLDFWDMVPGVTI